MLLGLNACHDPRWHSRTRPPWRLQPVPLRASSCAAAAPRTPPPERQPGGTPGLATEDRARRCQGESATSCEPSTPAATEPPRAQGLRSRRGSAPWDPLGRETSPLPRCGALGGDRPGIDGGALPRRSGTPPPCSRGGAGEARRAPSAASGAFLGAGFCRAKHFQLFQAAAEHTKQLGSSKSSAAARAQAPEAGPLTFSTNVSGTTTRAGPRLPGVPPSQASRGEQMFTLQESSPCP